MQGCGAINNSSDEDIEVATWNSIYAPTLSGTKGNTTDWVGPLITTLKT